MFSAGATTAQLSIYLSTLPIQHPIEMPTQRELLTALVQTCSSGTTPQARDIRLRTMTTILGTLVKLANNLIVQEIKEKHRSLRTTNKKLRSSLSLDDTDVAPHVQRILLAMGYCATTPDTVLHYSSKNSLSATWKVELDRSLGVVRSKSIIAMREIMHKVGESTSTTTNTTATTTISSSNLRSQSSPPKLKGPHVQIKCNNAIYMIPLSEEDTGKTITGAQLKEKVVVAMGNGAEGKNVVTSSSIKLIKKGKVIADADELSTSKKHKIKVMIQATEEEKKQTQRASAHSQQKERNDKANGVGQAVTEPKLSFEQQQDLMKMMSMGMALPPGKWLYLLVHSCCCGFLCFASAIVVVYSVHSDSHLSSILYCTIIPASFPFRRSQGNADTDVGTSGNGTHHALHYRQRHDEWFTTTTRNHASNDAQWWDAKYDGDDEWWRQSWRWRW